MKEKNKNWKDTWEKLSLPLRSGSIGLLFGLTYYIAAFQYIVRNTPFEFISNFFISLWVILLSPLSALYCSMLKILQNKNCGESEAFLFTYLGFIIAPLFGFIVGYIIGKIIDKIKRKTKR